MKYFRHITSVLVIILIAVLAAGTIVEKLHGSEFALAHVYSAWWFVGLWALVAIMIVIMMAKCRLWKRLSIGALHLSILLILLGAFSTVELDHHCCGEHCHICEVIHLVQVNIRLFVIALGALKALSLKGVKTFVRECSCHNQFSSINTLIILKIRLND